MAAKHDAVINELNFKIDKLIKLYISPLFNKSSRLDNTLSLSCKLLIVKIGVGVSKLDGFEVE